MQRVVLIAATPPRAREHKNKRTRPVKISYAEALARVQSDGNLDDIYPFHTDARQTLNYIRQQATGRTTVYFDHAWSSRLPYSNAGVTMWLYQRANGEVKPLQRLEQNAAAYHPEQVTPHLLEEVVQRELRQIESTAAKLQSMSPWYGFMYAGLSDSPGIQVFIPGVVDKIWLTQLAAIVLGREAESRRLHASGSLQDAGAIAIAMTRKLMRLDDARSYRAQLLAHAIRTDRAQSTAVLLVSYAMAKALQTELPAIAPGVSVEFHNLADPEQSAVYDQWFIHSSQGNVTLNDMAVLRTAINVYLDDWAREAGAPALSQALRGLGPNGCFEWFRSVYCSGQADLLAHVYGLLSSTIEWLQQKSCDLEFKKGWLWDGASFLGVQ